MNIDKQPMITIILLFSAALVLSFSVNAQRSMPAAQSVSQPDCDALVKWAEGHDSKEKITLAPEVTVSALFAADRTAPVFGTPAATWSRNDFTLVRNWLKDCRRDKRKDSIVSDLLYKTYQLVSQTAGPVYKMEQFRQRSARAVDNLVNYNRVNVLTQALNLAYQALQGNDVREEMRGLSVTSSVRGEIQALQNAHGYLTAADVDSLSAKLRAGTEDVKQETAALNDEFEALKNALAEVPLTMEGARMLDQFYNHPLLGKVPQQEALDFQNAIMQKRRVINVEVRQQEARQQAEAAAIPVEVTTVMAQLIAGESVSDISLRGVKPGIPYLYAKKFMSTGFSFKAPAGGDLFKEFGPTNQAVERYKKAGRRDGGRFEFETMGNTVGQVKYTEHFTGQMDLNEPRDWLTKKFGEPDQFKFLGNAIIMAWHDGGMSLVISPGNRTTLPFRNPQEYKSSLVVTLWSDDYQNYLAAAEKRCTELRNKPELSVQDKMDILNGCKN